MTKNIRNILLVSTTLSFLVSAPAQASTTDAIKALQEQVNALQKQLSALQANEEKRTASALSTEKSDGKEILPGISVKVGGYAAIDGIYRDNAQASDTYTGVGAIPYVNSSRADQDEFQASARASRLTLLAKGKVDEDLSLAAYFEGDFVGSANTSNSGETNSYVPRLRQAYATVDRNDWGLHVLGGQAWSLATTFKSGMSPRKELAPMTIDSFGTPGFVYTRGPQIRVVKDFADNKAHFGLSLENPEANTSGLRCTAKTTTGDCSTFSPNISVANAGTGYFAGTSQSLDYAPDVIAKVSYDTSIGHFEMFGLTRFFRDSVAATGTFHNNYAMGIGGGVSAYVPVIPQKLEVHANFMGGRGIGRYSASLMPDFAINESGDITPVTQLVGLVGVVAHPTTTLDMYLYAGAEKAMRLDASNALYGYGSKATDNGPCYTQNNASCFAQTETVWSITPGVWDTVYKGDYGNLKVGAQYSFTRKDAFSGANDKAPHAYENVVMTSFRYSPF